MPGLRVPCVSSRTASSQVAWALLTEGVTRARLESHRLQHLLNRALKLVEASKDKEHLYQIAGDIITGMPDRLDMLQQALDRTNLALSKMGQEFLSSRLSLSDKTLVDEALESAFSTPKPRHSEAATRIADKFLQKRLLQDTE